MDIMSIYFIASFLDNKLGVRYMKHVDDYYFDVIRKNIKKYRKLKNLTQQELADKAGLTMNYISKIESLKMQRGFTIPSLTRIADALEIDIKELFNEDI